MTFPNFVVEFSPTTSPFDTPVWISLSADGPHGNRVLSAEWNDGRQADSGDWPPGQATIVLDNHDRLFDPEHAGGDYFGDLLPRVPFRITVPEGYDDIYEDLYEGHVDLFYGFVEDGWEQDLMPPDDATCTVRLVDLLGVLPGYTLLTPAQHEVLFDDPAAYWSLDETTGTVMADRSGNGNHGTYDNATLGADPLIVDDAGHSATFAHVGDNRGQHKGANLPASAPVTLEAWVQFERELTEAHTILVCQRDTAFGSGLWLYVTTSADGSPNGELAINFFGLGGFYKARGHTRIDDGEPHHVVMTMASTAAADIKLYVDGELQTKTVISGTTGGTWNGHHIWVVGNVAASSTFDFGIGGEVDEVAVYRSALSAARVLAHYEAGGAGLAGQRSDEQIQWALDATGVPSSMYDLDEGRSIMGTANTAGRDVLDFIREMVRTEQGAFYVDHANGGVLRFRQRYASWQDTRSTVTQATFSDDPAASFDDVARVERGSLRVDPNGISTVVNQAKVSWRGGTETYDASAGSRYGPRGVSVDTQAASSAVARQLARWIVSNNDTPKPRIRSLGVNPGAAHTAFPVALYTQIGDRVAYRSHPQQVGSAITHELEVTGRKHNVQGVHWNVEFYLTAATSAEVDLFTLGVSELGSTHVLAY